MSQNSSAAQAVDTAVNSSSEEKVVRLLFVVKSSKGMKTPVNFLKRRGWQIAVVESIREAVPKIIEGKPTAVLLSWNLRGTNVVEAYKLLSSKFNSLCILFAEDASPKTELAMMGAGVPHIMLPPNSGPRIFTRVQTILRSLEKKDAPDDTKISGDDGFNLPPSASQVSPDKIPEDGAWIQINESADDKGVKNTYRFMSSNRAERSKSVYYFQGAQPPKWDSTYGKWQSSETEGGGLYFQDRAKDRTMQATQEGDAGRSYSTIQGGGESHGATSGQGMVVVKSGLSGGTQANYTPDQNPESNWGSATQEGGKSQSQRTRITNDVSDDEIEAAMADDGVSSDWGGTQGPSGSGRKKKGPAHYEDSGIDESNYQMTEGEIPSSDFPDSTPTERKGKASKGFAGQQADQPEEDLSDFGSPGPKGQSLRSGPKMETGSKMSMEMGQEGPGVMDLTQKSKAKDSLILKRKPKTILEKSIGEAVEEVSGKYAAKGEIFKLEPENQFFTVAVVKSPRFQGFLIMPSFGPGQEGKDKEIFKQVWSRMRSKMQDAGDPMEDMDTPLPFKLDALNFLQWAEMHAEYLTQGNYYNDEIAFAFLPTKETHLFEEANADMLKIPVKTLRPDVDLTFNLYLFMPKTTRYLLYFKPAFRITHDTLEKLEKFNVKQMFLKRDEERQFIAYTAACLMQNGR